MVHAGSRGHRGTAVTGCAGGIEQLAVRRVRIWVDIIAVAVGRRSRQMMRGGRVAAVVVATVVVRRGRLPARQAAHVRAATANATGATTAARRLDAGLKRRGRAVTRGVRGRAHVAVAAVNATATVATSDNTAAGAPEPQRRGGRDRARHAAALEVVTQMNRQGAAAGQGEVARLLDLLVDGSQLGGGRQRHSPLTRGGRRQRRACVIRADVAEPVRARRTADKTAHLVGRATRQDSSRGTGGILNGTRVVILVAGQGGAARKGLLAVGVGALVRALAGVDATMASQRAGVAKRLATALALVRLLAGVDTTVDGQSRALDELLAAAREVADMRTDASVNAFWMRSVLVWQYGQQTYCK